jgi:hypothetical protein
VTLLGKTGSIYQAQFSRPSWVRYLPVLFLAMCFALSSALLSVRSAAAETLCVNHSGNFVPCSDLASQVAAVPKSSSHVVLSVPVPVRKPSPVGRTQRGPNVSPPPLRVQQIHYSAPTLDPALITASGGALAAAGVVVGTGYIVSARRRRASPSRPNARHSMPGNVAP